MLPREDRLALLAESSYGAGKNKSTPNLRLVNHTLISKAESNMSLKRFNEVTSEAPSNPHRKEVLRLESNLDLLKKDQEYYEQTLFFALVYEQHPEYFDLLCAIPNGGYRKKAERYRLSVSGTKAGWPDTQLMKASIGYHGLFIEFKRVASSYKTINEAKKSVKEHQITTLNNLSAQGYAARVAFGAEEALAIFKAYLTSAKEFHELQLFFPIGDA